MNFMNNYNSNPIIIGIDHRYGNIKFTADGQKQYRSYSKAVVTAVNDYFKRQECIADDSYLETLEKEDAFLRRITETIEQGLRYAPVGMLPPAPPTAQPDPSAGDDEDISATLDFAESFLYYFCPGLVLY